MFRELLWKKHRFAVKASREPSAPVFCHCDVEGPHVGFVGRQDAIRQGSVFVAQHEAHWVVRVREALWRKRKRRSWVTELQVLELTLAVAVVEMGHQGLGAELLAAEVAGVRHRDLLSGCAAVVPSIMAPLHKRRHHCAPEGEFCKPAQRTALLLHGGVGARIVTNRKRPRSERGRMACGRSAHAPLSVLCVLPRRLCHRSVESLEFQLIHGQHAFRDAVLECPELSRRRRVRHLGRKVRVRPLLVGRQLRFGGRPFLEALGDMNPEAPAPEAAAAQETRVVEMSILEFIGGRGMAFLEVARHRRLDRAAASLMVEQCLSGGGRFGGAHVDVRRRHRPVELEAVMAGSVRLACAVVDRRMLHHRGTEATRFI